MLQTNPSKTQSDVRGGSQHGTYVDGAQLLATRTSAGLTTSTPAAAPSPSRLALSSVMVCRAEVDTRSGRVLVETCRLAVSATERWLEALAADPSGLPLC